MEKQLLDTFLDLYTYDTKIHEWSFEKYENNPLKQDLKNIEHVLHFCINPTEITYTQEELIKQFGFPEVDLRQIDIDSF
jgi:hypothetical protein